MMDFSLLPIVPSVASAERPGVEDQMLAVASHGFFFSQLRNGFSPRMARKHGWLSYGSQYQAVLRQS